MSTFHGLEIGKRSILAQQSALNTTGHNLANANTVGYTRQEAVLQATRSMSLPGMNNSTAPQQIGTGVEVTELRRIRDGFLDNQFRNEQQKAGYWEAKSSALSQLETVFNEPSDYGLSMTMDRFFQSMNELAKQPDSLALRSAVVSNGKMVADTFNSISNGIDQVESDLTSQLSGKALEVDQTVREVAQLNKQIASMTGADLQPNDLFDQRDLVLDKLSKLIDVKVTPNQNGTVNLSVDGASLVDGTKAETFTIDPQSGDALIAGRKVELAGGEVKGLQGSLSEHVSSLRDNVNQLAGTIAEQLNSIHASDDAKNMDGVSEKLPFFVYTEGSDQDASSIMINPELLNSPAKLAAGKSAAIGDGSNAQEMANLQSERMEIGQSTTTISGFYQMVITQVGMDVQEAERWSEHADRALQQVDNRRLSISGVSIDEEMTNMVRFQQAYNAAAKYVSTVDEMLDRLINGIR